MARKILFEIEIENVGAARRIEALREEIRRLNKELKGADVGSDAFKELIAKITDAKLETAELKEEQKKLNREFQAAKFPKDSLQGLRIEYAKLTDQIKILSAAERASPFGQSLIANAANVKKQIDGIEQSIGRFTGNVGNYRSAFDGLNNVLLSIGAGFGVNEIIQQNTRLSDSIANVAKTTGLTIEEAEKLAEVLKFRDTRTNLADQLKITEIGGQLGIATDQLQAFTEGVDVLNVALGDQFGSVDNLTREFAGLRNVLTDFKTEDAADDILKLGNAVNFLEAQGNATGQSIVDFAGRIAGAGVPLGATTAQIIGLSTTLSELSINPERGATAVSRLLTEVARSPEVFAQAIGEPADRFTKLVQADIVGALALVSERIAGSSETNTAFAQTLEALGIGAQGAIEVFGKLGGSTDLLRQRIGEAGKTLQNTDSITREFEVKNNNAAAAVEKLRNAITGALTGTDAQEAIAAIAGSLTDLIGVLGDTFEFLKENELVAIEFAAALIYLNRQGILAAIPLLRTLGISLGIFTVNAETGAIATNTLTTAQGRAAIAAGVQATATRALALAQSALPFVAVIAATYALVQAWDAYEASASASEKAASALADAQKEIAEESAKEVTAVRASISVLQSDKTTKVQRKEAIDDLVKAYPEYLKNINLETASVERLNVIQGQLIDSIIRSGIERRKNIELEKIDSQIIDERLNQDRIRRGELSFQEKAAILTAKAAKVATGEILNTSQAVDVLISESIRKEKELLQAREATAAAFDRAKPQELVLVVPERGAGDGAKELGEESEKAGDKIKGLGDKSKEAKDKIQAQAGSVAALRDEISKLEKQIAATAPDSPKLAGLGKQLRELRKQLVAAERAVKAAELEPGKITADEQPKIGVVVELEPDSAERLKAQTEEARFAAEQALKAIGFPIEIIPPSDEEISRAQVVFDAQRQEGKNIKEQADQANADAAAEAEKRKERLTEFKDAAIEAGGIASNAIFEIQRNNQQRLVETQLAALDLETQNRIDAAQGNKVKIAAIEKDAAAKRQAIEKQSAEERKKIAIKEALINTALAIVKALPNLVLAGFAAAAGLAQVAIIRSQEFWEGGVVKSDGLLDLGKTYIRQFYTGGAVAPDDPDVMQRMKGLYLQELATGGTIKRLKPGIITEPQNAPRTPHGDTVLAYLAPGEMVLNEPQQNTLRSLFGQDAFALAGVPGEASTRQRKLPGFASGGVVGIVPQNGFAQQVSGQQVSVEAKAEFSGEQIETLGQDMGAIIAAEVARQMRVGLAEGLFDANRRLEREAISDQNRRG